MQPQTVTDLNPSVSEMFDGRLLAKDTDTQQEETKQLEESKQEDVKVARPTTNPTLRGKRTEQDIKDFSQMFAPKKLEADVAAKLQKDQGAATSAWNKGQTWENKTLKVDQVKAYLESCNMIIADNEDSESKLQLTKVKSIQGEASIAVVRGEPRMGYELDLKLQLEGMKDTFLDGLVCELKLEEFLDDGSEPSDFSISVEKLLDTEQGSQAKACVGYKDNCSKICKKLREVLKQYPYATQK